MICVCATALTPAQMPWPFWQIDSAPESGTLFVSNLRTVFFLRCLCSFRAQQSANSPLCVDFLDPFVSFFWSIFYFWAARDGSFSNVQIALIDPQITSALFSSETRSPPQMQKTRWERTTKPEWTKANWRSRKRWRTRNQSVGSILREYSNLEEKLQLQLERWFKVWIKHSCHNQILKSKISSESIKGYNLTEF